MQKISKFFSAILVLVAQATMAVTPPASAPKVTTAQDSVTTIDTLVKIDNAAALAKAKADAISSGLIKAEVKPGSGGVALKPVEQPMQLRVVAIAALRNDYSLKLNVNGQNYENLRVGSSIKGCVVAEVRDRCVVLQPQPKEEVLAATPAAPASTPQTRKGKHKKAVTVAQAPKPQMCPTACWTGVSPMQQSVIPTATSMSAGGPPLPPPLMQPKIISTPAGAAAASSAGSSFN